MPSMSLENELRQEIEKWRNMLDRELPLVLPSDEAGKRMLANVRAYRQDCDHFFSRGDLVKSFECLVWAWAFLEIGRNLGHLTER
jgi:hypothetical protein